MSFIGKITGNLLSGLFGNKSKRTITPPSAVSKGDKEPEAEQGDEKTNRQRTINISEDGQQASRGKKVKPPERNTYDYRKP